MFGFGLVPEFFGLDDRLGQNGGFGLWARSHRICHSLPCNSGGCCNEMMIIVVMMMNMLMMIMVMMMMMQPWVVL